MGNRASNNTRRLTDPRAEWRHTVRGILFILLLLSITGGAGALAGIIAVARGWVTP